MHLYALIVLHVTTSTSVRSKCRLGKHFAELLRSAYQGQLELLDAGHFNSPSHSDHMALASSTARASPHANWKGSTSYSAWIAYNPMA